MHELLIRLPRGRQSVFFPMLQTGCRLPNPGRVSIQDFLTQTLGLAPEALARIQTVFLNGRPVDDLEAASVAPGCEIALSAAMPGALGAVMRRGGFYASMRKDITHHEGASGAGNRAGHVMVKVFNLLISEIGPVILARGLLATPGEAAALAPRLAEAGARVWLDDEPLEPARLKSLALFAQGWLRLSVVLTDS